MSYKWNAAEIVPGVEQECNKSLFTRRIVSGEATAKTKSLPGTDTLQTNYYFV